MARLLHTTPTPSIPMSPWLRDAIRLLDTSQREDIDLLQSGGEALDLPAGAVSGFGGDRLVLTALLRLAHVLADDDLSDMLWTRGALTVIDTRDTELARACKVALRDGLLAAAERRASLHSDGRVLVQAATGRTDGKSGDDLEKALAEAAPLIVITDTASALPRRLRDAATREIALPPLDGALLLEHLKVLHPRGRIDETALRAAMPDDAALARLSVPDLVLALRRPSHRAVIDAVRACVGGREDPRRFRALDRIRGLGAHRALLERLVEDLHGWRAGEIPWSDVPRGLLLSGAPGVGKTACVRALAQDAEVHLQACSMAKWQAAGHLGDMLRAMRNDFAEARRAAPSILFIDELDSVADRARVTGHNASYDTSVTNALLEQLDGIDAAEGVLVIAACNAPQRLDPALTRSGRLDMHLEIGLPDRTALREMLHDLLGDALEDPVLDEAAEHLIGFTGADVAAVVRSALTRARVRGRRSPLRAEDLRAALLHRVSERDARALWRMAVHEAGHVLALAATGRTLPERGEIGPGGGTVEAPRVRGERTLAALEDELVVLLAGRAAEGLVLGGPSAGAGGGPTSDLGRATRLATMIEGSSGLGQAGPLWIDPDVVSLAADPGLKAAVQARLARAEAAADDLVAENRAVLERVAQALLASRSLGRTELAGLIGRDAADDDLPDKAPAPA